MIKRMTKEIYTEKWIFLSLAVVFCLVEYAQAVLFVSAGIYESCILDAYVWGSSHAQSTFYNITMLISVMILRNSFRTEKIVREKSCAGLWLYMGLKVMVISLISAILSVVMAFGVGRITSDVWCNWEKKKVIATEF